MSPKPIPTVPSPWRELAAIVMRKQRPSLLAAAGYPADARFPVVNGPVSSILVPLVLIGLFCDAPLSLVMVALCHPSNPTLIHVAVATIGLMTLGWAIAVRSVLRSMPMLSVVSLYGSVALDTLEWFPRPPSREF